MFYQTVCLPLFVKTLYEREEKQPKESHNETCEAEQRVVLLGASNLSRTFPTIVQVAQRMFSTPSEFLVAKGHGRSFGQESCLFGKKICGILQNNLWANLHREISIPTYALITDVGNDLAYGASVETIIGWIDRTIEQLQTADAQVVMTGLPIGPIRALGEKKYRLLRALFFPSCRLSLQEIRARAERLGEALEEKAASKKVPIFNACDEWYGFDPIHIRRSLSDEIWSQILGAWNRQSAGDGPSRSARLQAMYLRCLKPARWSHFGIQRTARQPNGRLHDGTTVALF